jgi:hypothetical protein
MFATHASRTAEYAQQSPDNLVRTIAFVLTTIRSPIERAPVEVAEVDALGDKAPSLWGDKARGYRYASKHKEQLYADCMACHAADDTVGLLKVLLAVPMLGLPKAGFVSQLAFGRVGCLDTHNLERYGLKAAAFATSGLKPDGQALDRKCRLYLETCEELGGCEQLWDTWCDYVAAQYPDRFADGDAVSVIHCVALTLPTEA